MPASGMLSRLTLPPCSFMISFTRGEAQAGAGDVAGSVAAVEAVEGVGSLLGVHADAVVAHGDADEGEADAGVARRAHRPRCRRPAAKTSARIRQQVEQGLLELALIDADAGRALRDAGHQAMACGGREETGQRFLEQQAERERLELEALRAPGLDAGEVDRC